MSTSNSSFTRIGKNTIALYCRSIIAMFISLYTSRVLLQVIGVDDFGIYNVVGGMVMLFSFLSVALMVSTQRFMNVEMGRGNTEEVNLVFCTSVNIQILIANVPGGIRVPVYSTIHDVIFLDIKGLSSRLGTLLRWAFYKRAIYLSEALFTVSEFSATRIRNHFHTKKDIHVTFSAISKQIKGYIPKKERVYDFLYYVYIGNIKKHKGIDILIKAINESNERGFDIKLVVVGDYKKIKTKDKNVMNLLNSANNNVLFTGFVPNDKLYDILSQSLALVLPTHYEGFGLPPLESLYLGGNAIITDLPVLREVYSELPVSFFKEGDVNALAELLMLKLQLNTDVARTREYIDCHYNFEIIADKIIQVIENHHVS